MFQARLATMENTGDSEDSIQHLKHERHFNEEYKNGSVSEVSTYYLHTYTYLFTISSHKNFAFVS